jgi:hypothetical protein
LIAALFVANGGVYFGLPDVDPWDKKRDARLYAGPHPVVAHPPCERWGRYWFGGPSVKVRKELGDDGGCFASALASVEKWGGVLEHPEGSHAWRRFGIPTPPKYGGWFRTIRSGWTCCVEQGNYGHRARKATWLYFVGCYSPIPLLWGRSAASVRLDDGFHSAAERARGRRSGVTERLGQREQMATPESFRDALLNLANLAASKGRAA